MPDLATIATTVVSLLTGGGIVTWYKAHLKSDQQQHDQSLDWTDRITTRLDKVEQRLDETEAELEQSRRAKAELSTQVQLLIERIDTLLDRLQAYEDITEQERQRYKDLPTTHSSPADVSAAE